MHWFSTAYLAAYFMSLSKVFGATLGAVLNSHACGNIQVLNLKLFTVTPAVVRSVVRLPPCRCAHQNSFMSLCDPPKLPTPVDNDVMLCCVIMFCIMLNTIKFMYTARVELTCSFNSANDLKTDLTAALWLSATLKSCVIKHVSLLCVICLFSLMSGWGWQD